MFDRRAYVHKCRQQQSKRKERKKEKKMKKTQETRNVLNYKCTLDENRMDGNMFMANKTQIFMRLRIH